MLSNIGFIGLAVMGENLVINMANKGFSVSVYNRTIKRVDDFINGRGKNEKIKGCHSIEELVDSLEKPRMIMMMVKAGEAVDDMIECLIPHLEKGDIIIDGGNSNFKDTIRRTEYVESKGLLYIGTGVSGGEEGALNGPSIMPGGSEAAWERVKPVFHAICAKTEDGNACCNWVGKNGAGHFVKMVHNGIEYGDMQLICESYQLMRDGLGMSNEKIHKAFSKFNEGELDSYLIEITKNIFSYKDEDGNEVVDQILDSAGQKGTGKWAGITALDEGSALTLIVEAVFARCLSSIKEERRKARSLYNKKIKKIEENEDTFIEKIGKALYISKIMSYAQGFALMKEAAKTYDWNLNYGDIALMWRGGCIIRSRFLEKIKDAYDKNPNLNNILLDEYFHRIIDEGIDSLRQVLSSAVLSGVPMPAFSAALSFFDGYTCESLPANLLQAQRDYFGAHTYERVDRPRGEHFHTNWTGCGGKTTAETYGV